MKYKVTDAQLTDIADAIRTKGGTSSDLEFPNGFVGAIEDISGITAEDEGKVVSNGALVTQTSRTVTANGTVDTTANNSVLVNVSSGGELVPKKDVNFIDYDGSIVCSYTKSEFLALSAMPSNPSHNGLTSQGWNWSLSDAKSYVTANGGLCIGQNYVTYDGVTYIDIDVPDYRTSLWLGLAIDGEVTVYWDSETTETMTGTDETTAVYAGHNYSTGGRKQIAIVPSNGTSFTIRGGNNSSSRLICGLISDTVNANYSKAINLVVRNIRLGNNVSIGSDAFGSCLFLETITIPSTISSFGTAAFTGCASLKSVTIPSGVTTITSSVFYGCSALTNDTLSIPASVETVNQSAFYNCKGLTYVLLNGISTISTQSFSNCFGLDYVYVPSSITDIPVNAFSGCYGLLAVKFESSTPPTLAATNAFANIPSTCQFHVPQGSLEDYQTATNWTSFANRFVEYT